MKKLDEFIKESKRNKETVKKWIRDGKVNGAEYSEGEYTISDMARPPYTRASSKNASSIRKGIIVGCKRRLSVNARVFDISECEFEIYVNQLIELGFIERNIIDGVEYYYSTPKTDELTESKIYRMMKDITAEVAGRAVGVMAEGVIGK